MNREPWSAASSAVGPGELEIAPSSRPVGSRLAGRSRRRRRNDWRLGGRAVEKWDARLIAAVTFGAGLGLLTAAIVSRFAGSSSVPLSLLGLWTGLVGSIIYGLMRSRPAGLLRFRAQDVLWGLGLGVVLRLVQGAISGANTSPFPASPGVSNLLTDLLTTGVAGPLVEETFFRGLVLVTVFQMLRKPVGTLSASLTALLVSAVSFALLHALFAPLTGIAFFGLLIIGLSCASLVLLTGRIWGAVLTHMVYNTSFVLLSLIGSVLN